MSTPNDIRILPQEVVARIKAGEVVQRAASAVKELIENSLDAGATEIIVTTAPDVLSHISVQDNGCGMLPASLALAVQRHATSKLRTTEDLSKLVSFGFRGEALASLCQVAQKVQLTSRTADAAVAYTQTFAVVHAAHNPPNKKQENPTPPPPPPIKPIARKPGTTIAVHNLFFHMPQRQKVRAADEYTAILQIVQQYAILYAPKGIGFVCQRRNKVDLNTNPLVQALRGRTTTERKDSTKEQQQQQQEKEEEERQRQQVTQRVIAQVYGSHLLPHLLPFACQQENVFSSWGFFTAQVPNKRTNFVLFVNDRLVECHTLKKQLEELFSGYKPFLCVSLQVPPHQVDVNVHPTKRQVALLHLDEICQEIVHTVQQMLLQQQQSFATNNVSGLLDNHRHHADEKPLSQSILPASRSQNPKKRPAENEAKTPEEEEKEEAEADADEDDTESVVEDDTAPTEEQEASSSASKKKPSKPGSSSESRKPAPLSTKRVRTSQATHAGALVPFLVRTQSQSQSQSQLLSQSQSSATQQTLLSPTQSETNHEPNCPLAKGNNVNADLTQPGAFAAVAALCNCRRPTPSQQQPEQPANSIRLPRQALVRPKKVHPTPCTYVSIQQLRRRIPKRAWSTVQQLKLRTACFVGVVSPQRSLIQCGDELILLQHYDFARSLFYQMALYRFGGGATVAKLPSGMDVAVAVGECVQLEEDLRSNTQEVVAEETSCVSEANVILGEQAALCLYEHAEMLQEYFSVVIEKDSSGKVLLTGLPVLLDGYEPFPHGLPLFLLRLATEVNWSEEKPCFHGVCRELALFYSQLPDDEQELTPFVRHTLFPAITTLLIPSVDLLKDNGFVTLTSLNKLYRTFERC